jgi:hypothetical protein
VPSPNSVASSEPNGAQAGKRSWRADRPKGKIRSALERRRLIAELRETQKELEKERDRNAKLSDELEQLKSRRSPARPKRAAKRRPKPSR